MKAIQVRNVGGPEALALVDVPMPEPKADEALVELEAIGVNFIDYDKLTAQQKIRLKRILRDRIRSLKKRLSEIERALKLVEKKTKRKKSRR